MAEHELSKVKACRSVKLSRSAYYRQTRENRDRDKAVIDALNDLVEKHPRWGFGLCFDTLRLNGFSWNHKRVHRVYKAMGLNLPRRKKRRLPDRPRHPLDAPEIVNHIWSLDFMSDALYQGKRRFRTLNVLDEGVREILAIVIDTSIPGGRVVRTLEQLVDWRGKPLAIRVDNGPEFVSQVFVEWCKANGIELCYIQPGKPNQNAFIERFNRTYRHEVLDAYVFESLQQVRQLTAQWMKEYNEERPHESLGQIPPAMFRRQLEIAENSSYELPH